MSCTHISNIHSQILSWLMIKMNNIVSLPVLFQHFAFEADKLYLCCCYFKWSFKKLSTISRRHESQNLLSMFLGKSMPQNHEKKYAWLFGYSHLLFQIFMLETWLILNCLLKCILNAKPVREWKESGALPTLLTSTSKNLITSKNEESDYR